MQNFLSVTGKEDIAKPHWTWLQGELCFLQTRLKFRRRFSRLLDIKDYQPTRSADTIFVDTVPDETNSFFNGSNKFQFLFQANTMNKSRKKLQN